jgi:hypothetical protein
MMWHKYGIITVLAVILAAASIPALAQEDFEDEVIRYYQMETMDDSLFIRIQEEVKIDPPNPKAEMVVDLRDPQNQTVTIQGMVFPFLAFSPETRARIMTFPFKLNLEEQTTYTSVFTRVVKKIRFRRLVEPPHKNQILSTRGYVNPYFQLYGGERLGFAIKRDIGLTIGTGTPYSGALESDQVEVNLHALGARVGMITAASFLVGKTLNQSLQGDTSSSFTLNRGNRMHLHYATSALQVAYVIPLGNFFEVGYQQALEEMAPAELSYILHDSADGYTPKVMTGSYFNWEFRYPMRNQGSTRAKAYLASYQNELHLGYTGRELALVGSNFDFRFDLMFPQGRNRERPPQLAMEVMVQKIAEGWASSVISVGPSIIVGRNDRGKLGVNTLFFNLRVKLGSSL